MSKLDKTTEELLFDFLQTDDHYLADLLYEARTLGVWVELKDESGDRSILIGAHNEE